MAMSVHRRRDRSTVIHYVVLRLLHRARRVAGSYPGHVWPAAGHAHPSRPTRTTALVRCNLLHPVPSLPAARIGLVEVNENLPTNSLHPHQVGSGVRRCDSVRIKNIPASSNELIQKVNKLDYIIE